MNQNKGIWIVAAICALTVIINLWLAYSKENPKDEIKPASPKSFAPQDGQLLKDTANIRVRFDTTAGGRQWVAWTDGHAINSYIVQENNGKKFVYAKTMETLYYDKDWKQITSKNVIR